MIIRLTSCSTSLAWVFPLWWSPTITFRDRVEDLEKNRWLIIMRFHEFLLLWNINFTNILYWQLIFTHPSTQWAAVIKYLLLMMVAPQTWAVPSQVVDLMEACQGQLWGSASSPPTIRRPPLTPHPWRKKLIFIQ